MSDTGGETGRETWATRTGFILAAVGSAVGLGNIWRFPFMVGQEGGAAFLVIYLLFVALVGFPAILVEFVIGRRTSLNPVGALRELGGDAWRYLGYVFFVTAFVILSYYSVVAGWFVRYFVMGITRGYTDALASHESAAADAGADVTPAQLLFSDIATGLDAVVLHVLFMGLAIAIVAFGVRRGIEVAAKVMVPSIVALLVLLAVYGATLNGAGEAYSYYLSPDLGTITSEFTSILPAAAGQAFFTLSLGMGIMITFASYLGEDRNLAKDAAIIVGIDSAIAFLVGLVVFPVIFTAGADPGQRTVGAIFFSLTPAFADIPAGRILGLVFYGVVVIAALSSAISLLEFVVAYFVDEHGLDRKLAAIGAGGGMILLGLPVTYDLVFLDLLDLFVNGILLLLGALLLVLFVGWLIPDVSLDELGRGIGDLGSYGVTWLWLVRTLVALAIFVSLVLGVQEYVDFLTGDFADWLESR